MNYVGSISIIDRGDAPAKAVIDKNVRSLAQRVADETKEELDKVMDRVDNIYVSYEMSTQTMFENPRGSANVEYIEDIKELEEIITDTVKKKKYQQQVTIFVVGFQDVCAQKMQLLQQVNQFFLDNSKLDEDELLGDKPDIDLEEASNKVNESLSTAEELGKRLSDLNQDIIEWLVNYANTKASNKGKKRLEKSLESAKQELADLSEKLLKLQTELEEKDEKFQQVAKQLEAKTQEAVRYKTAAEVAKKSAQDNEAHTSVLQEEITRRDEKILELRTKLSRLEISLSETQFDKELSTRRLDNANQQTKKLQTQEQEKLAKLQEEVDTKKMAISDAEREMEKLHREQLATLQKTHQQEIEDMKKEHDEEITRLTEELQLLQEQMMVAEQQALQASVNSEGLRAKLLELELRDTHLEEVDIPVSRESSSRLSGKSVGEFSAGEEDRLSRQESRQSTKDTKKKTETLKPSKTPTSKSPNRLGKERAGRSPKDFADASIQDEGGDSSRAFVEKSNEASRQATKQSKNLEPVLEGDGSEFPNAFDLDDDEAWAGVPAQQIPGRFNQYRQLTVAKIKDLEEQLQVTLTKTHRKVNSLKSQFNEHKGKWEAERKILIEQVEQAQKLQTDAEKEADAAMTQLEEFINEQEKLEDEEEQKRQEIIKTMSRPGTVKPSSPPPEPKQEDQQGQGDRLHSENSEQELKNLMQQTDDAKSRAASSLSAGESSSLAPWLTPEYIQGKIKSKKEITPALSQNDNPTSRLTSLADAEIQNIGDGTDTKMSSRTVHEFTKVKGEGHLPIEGVRGERERLMSRASSKASRRPNIKSPFQLEERDEEEEFDDDDDDDIAPWFRNLGQGPNRSQSVTRPRSEMTLSRSKSLVDDASDDFRHSRSRLSGQRSKSLEAISRIRQRSRSGSDSSSTEDDNKFEGVLRWGKKVKTLSKQKPKNKMQTDDAIAAVSKANAQKTRQTPLARFDLKRQKLVPIAKKKSKIAVVNLDFKKEQKKIEEALEKKRAKDKAKSEQKESPKPPVKKGNFRRRTSSAMVPKELQEKLNTEIERLRRIRSSLGQVEEPASPIASDNESDADTLNDDSDGQDLDRDNELKSRVEETPRNIDMILDQSETVKIEQYEDQKIRDMPEADLDKKKERTPDREIEDVEEIDLTEMTSRTAVLTSRNTLQQSRNTIPAGRLTQQSLKSVSLVIATEDLDLEDVGEGHMLEGHINEEQTVESQGHVDDKSSSEGKHDENMTFRLKSSREYERGVAAVSVNVLHTPEAESQVSSALDGQAQKNARQTGAISAPPAVEPGDGHRQKSEGLKPADCKPGEREVIEEDNESKPVTSRERKSSAQSRISLGQQTPASMPIRAFGTPRSDRIKSRGSVFSDDSMSTGTDPDEGVDMEIGQSQADALQNMKSMMAEESFTPEQQKTLDSLRSAIRTLSRDQALRDAQLERTVTILSLASQIACESAELGILADGVFEGLAKMESRAITRLSDHLSQKRFKKPDKGENPPGSSLPQKLENTNKFTESKVTEKSDTDEKLVQSGVPKELENTSKSIESQATEKPGADEKPAESSVRKELENNSKFSESGMNGEPDKAGNSTGSNVPQKPENTESKVNVANELKGVEPLQDAQFHLEKQSRLKSSKSYGQTQSFRSLNYNPEQSSKSHGPTQSFRSLNYNPEQSSKSYGQTQSFRSLNYNPEQREAKLFADDVTEQRKHSGGQESDKTLEFSLSGSDKADFLSSRGDSFSASIPRTMTSSEWRRLSPHDPLSPNYVKKPKLPAIPKDSNKKQLIEEFVAKQSESHLSVDDLFEDDANVAESRISTISVVISPKKKSRPVTMEQMLYGEGSIAVAPAGRDTAFEILHDNESRILRSLEPSRSVQRSKMKSHDDEGQIPISLEPSRSLQRSKIKSHDDEGQIPRSFEPLRSLQRSKIKSHDDESHLLKPVEQTVSVHGSHGEDHVTRSRSKTPLPPLSGEKHDTKTERRARDSANTKTSSQSYTSTNTPSRQSPKSRRKLSQSDVSTHSDLQQPKSPSTLDRVSPVTINRASPVAINMSPRTPATPGTAVSDVQRPVSISSVKPIISDTPPPYLHNALPAHLHKETQTEDWFSHIEREPITGNSEDEVRQSSAKSRASLRNQFKSRLDETRQAVEERRIKSPVIMVPAQKSIDDELIIEEDDDLPIPDDMKEEAYMKEDTMDAGTSPPPGKQDQSRKISKAQWKLTNLAEHPVVHEYLRAYNGIHNFKEAMSRVLVEKDQMSASQILADLDIIPFNKDTKVVPQIAKMTENVYYVLNEVSQVVNSVLQNDRGPVVSSLMMGMSRDVTQRTILREKSGATGDQPLDTRGSQRTSSTKAGSVSTDAAQYQELQTQYEKLQNQMSEESKKYENQQRHNVVVMMEMQDTINQLQRELSALGKQTRRPPSESVSTAGQQPVDSAIMFTRLDSERNAKIMKKAVNEKKLDANRYKEAMVQMDDYVNLPAQRLAHLVRKYVHHCRMKEIEANVHKSRSLDDNVFQLFDKMEALQTRRAKRWSDRMDEMGMERYHLANMLMETLDSIEQESGIFLIKPMYSYRGREPKDQPYSGKITRPFRPHRTLSPLRDNNSAYAPAPTPASNVRPRHRQHKEDLYRQPTTSQSQVQYVPKGPLEGDSTGLLGSSMGFIGTQPRATWSMADSQIGINNPMLGNVNTPRILELDINRMMIGQNTISAQIGAQGLSNDRLVNAANNNLRSYMTVNRPGPSSAGKTERPLSGSRQSPRPSSSPTNHSSSTAKRVRLSDVEIPSMMATNEPLPPIGGTADRPRSGSGKGRQSPPRIPVGNELPESPPGSSLRHSPPGEDDDIEITSPEK